MTPIRRCRFRAFARRYTRCAILERRIVRFGLTLRALRAGRAFATAVPTSDVSLSRLGHRRRIPSSVGSLECVLFRDRVPSPESPGFPLRDSVRSSKTKTRDAYRRTSPTEHLLLRALARSEPWSLFGRSAITLRVPFRSGPSRRARQRVPSSFTSAEDVFLRSFEREDDRDTCCRRMPPTT